MARRLKSVVDVPVCVGLSASQADHARTVADAGANGVVIGSRLVAIIEDHLETPHNAIEQITQFLLKVRAALSP